MIERDVSTTAGVSAYGKIKNAHNQRKEPYKNI